MKAVFAAVLLTLFAAPAWADEAPPPTIDITAEAEVRVVPDLATVSASVVTDGATAQAAMAANAKKMAAARDALIAAGVDEADIQTSGLHLNPEYTYDPKEPGRPGRIANYKAVNSLDVRFKDLKKTGPTLDALVQAGMNQISGPGFSVADPDKALDAARKEAVKKAQSRAALYAEALGVKLKRVLSVTETMPGGGVPPPMPMMKMAMAEMAASADTSVAPGQMTLRVGVMLRYEISQ